MQNHAGGVKPGLYGELGITQTYNRCESIFQRTLESFSRPQHREIFFQYTWVDYSTHKPGTFRLVISMPPELGGANWQLVSRTCPLASRTAFATAVVTVFNTSRSSASPSGRLASVSLRPCWP